jgi:Tol biopolymer transport system component
MTKFELTDDLLHKALRIEVAQLPSDLVRDVHDAIALTPRAGRFPWDGRFRGSVAGVALLATLLLLTALAVGLVGSQRRLPPPFGLAANGVVAYLSNGRVYTSDPAAPSATPLTTGTLVELAPVFSRDGTRIAFKRLVSGEPAGDPPLLTDVVVTDALGGHEVLVDPAAIGMSGISWSPDSHFLLYSREVRGRRLVFVAAADGTGVRQVGDLAGDAWSPSWSPDGQWIVVAIDDRSIYVLDRSGSQPRRLTDATYAQIGHVEWSPDGSRILFSAQISPGDRGHIYLVGLDGSTEGEIAPSERAQAEGVWSPDGSRIAFLRAGPPSGPTVVIADAAGTVIRTLPGNYGWYAPTWSPDGTRLAITDDRPGPENIAGPIVITILDPIGDALPITLKPSPDSRLGTESGGLTWQRLAP